MDTTIFFKTLKTVERNHLFLKTLDLTIIFTQGGYNYLDAEPRTLAAKDHRPAYGSDGDYYSKPSADDVFDTVYEMMQESNPAKFPRIY